MIKLVMCLSRRSDMTRDQFQDYWLNKHGPFFKQNAGEMRAKKYVQSLTIETPLNKEMRNSRGMLPEYDGVAEVWFASEDVPIACHFARLRKRRAKPRSPLITGVMRVS